MGLAYLGILFFASSVLPRENPTPTFSRAKAVPVVATAASPKNSSSSIW